MFQFFDAQEPGKIADMARVSVPGQDAEFREFTAEVAMPKPLRGRKIAVNFMLYLYGTGRLRVGRRAP